MAEKPHQPDTQIMYIRDQLILAEDDCFDIDCERTVSLKSNFQTLWFYFDIGIFDIAYGLRIPVIFRLVLCDLPSFSEYTSPWVDT